jgi:hypothetical protein
VAKGDIFKGTALWCKAMLKKATNADEELAVDVALQEAFNLLRKAKLDNERSRADEIAELLVAQMRDALAGTARESLHPSSASHEAAKDTKTK